MCGSPVNYSKHGWEVIVYASPIPKFARERVFLLDQSPGHATATGSTGESRFWQPASLLVFTIV